MKMNILTGGRMRGKERGITLLSAKSSGIEMCRVHVGNIPHHPEELCLRFIFKETDSCTDTLVQEHRC